MFNKGPTQKLPEGITRYEMVYKVQLEDDRWEVYRMHRTAPVGAERAVAGELRDRLTQKPNRFEIVTIRDVGGEVPVQTGKPTMVVTPEEYERQREADRAKFGKNEIRERAKELGLWYPGLEDKFDA